MTLPSSVKEAHLSVVDTDNATNHLGDDDHVTQVGLDDSGLLIGGSFLLGFAELLDETHGLALETALETTAGAGVDELEVQDKKGKEGEKGKGEYCELLSVLWGLKGGVSIPQRTVII